MTATNTGDKYGPKTPGLIRCYGCVKCQKEHREGIDAEFDQHALHQSKHGVYERAPVDMGERFAAEFDRLAREQKAKDEYHQRQIEHAAKLGIPAKALAEI